jgi:hypothetical protein
MPLVMLAVGLRGQRRLEVLSRRRVGPVVCTLGAVIVVTLSGCSSAKSATGRAPSTPPTATRPFSFPTITISPSAQAPILVADSTPVAESTSAAVATSVASAVPVSSVAPLASISPAASVTTSSVVLTPDGFRFVTLKTRVVDDADASTESTMLVPPDSSQAQPTLPAQDVAMLRQLTAQQLDESYIQFMSAKPNVSALVDFIASADREAFEAYFRTLADDGHRWIYPSQDPRVQDLTINRIDYVSDGVADVETCEWSNITHYQRTERDFGRTEDTIITRGLASRIRRQTWVKENGQWKATIDVDRQVFEGENRCEN